MKKQLYVHIGTPKTGTSAIQIYCSTNNERIKATGTIYPDLGYEFPGIGVNRNAHFLVNTIKGENGKRDKEAEDSLISDGLSKVMALFNEYDKVILSDENLWNSGAFKDPKIKLLKKTCDEHDVELKMIVYLRRQDTLIQSYWAQQVKEKSTLTFREYIDSGKYKFFKLDYYDRLNALAAIIGKENITVRIYEKSAYYKGSITADFLHLIGIETDASFVEPDHVVNPSISGPVLELKRRLNRNEEFGRKGSFIMPALTAVQKEYSDTPGFKDAAYFTPDMHRDFMEQFAESNRAVAVEYLGKENGILFEEEIKAPEAEQEVVEEYDADELIEVCGKLLMEQQVIIDNLKTKLKEKSDDLCTTRKEFSDMERTLNQTQNKLNSMIAYYNQGLFKRGTVKVRKMFSKKS